LSRRRRCRGPRAAPQAENYRCSLTLVRTNGVGSDPTHLGGTPQVDTQIPNRVSGVVGWAHAGPMGFDSVRL
jgi:hypothetical protein